MSAEQVWLTSVPQVVADEISALLPVIRHTSDELLLTKLKIRLVLYRVRELLLNNSIGQLFKSFLVAFGMKESMAQEISRVSQWFKLEQVQGHTLEDAMEFFEQLVKNRKNDSGRSVCLNHFTYLSSTLNKTPTDNNTLYELLRTPIKELTESKISNQSEPNPKPRFARHPGEDEAEEEKKDDDEEVETTMDETKVKEDAEARIDFASKNFTTDRKSVRIVSTGYIKQRRHRTSTSRRQHEEISSASTSTRSLKHQQRQVERRSVIKSQSPLEDRSVSLLSTTIDHLSISPTQECTPPQKLSPVRRRSNLNMQGTSSPFGSSRSSCSSITTAASTNSSTNEMLHSLRKDLSLLQSGLHSYLSVEETSASNGISPEVASSSSTSSSSVERADPSQIQRLLSSITASFSRLTQTNARITTSGIHDQDTMRLVAMYCEKQAHLVSNAGDLICQDTGKTRAKSAELATRKQQSTQVPESNHPVSITYGSITAADCWSVMNLFCSDAIPPHLQIGSTSHFLDIGSGMGGVVLQFQLRFGMESAVGIECVQGRFLKAVELHKQFKSGLHSTATKLRKVWDYDLHQTELNSITFIDGKIEDHPELIGKSTHVFLFDAHFSEESWQFLVPHLWSGRPRVVLTCLCPSRLQPMLPSGANYHLFQVITMHLTGGSGNSRSGYLYITHPASDTSRNQSQTF